VVRDMTPPLVADVCHVATRIETTAGGRLTEGR